jgi:hypothetical protein
LDPSEKNNKFKTIAPKEASTQHFFKVFFNKYDSNGLEMVLTNVVFGMRVLEVWFDANIRLIPPHESR